MPLQKVKQNPASCHLVKAFRLESLDAIETVLKQHNLQSERRKGELHFVAGWPVIHALSKFAPVFMMEHRQELFVESLDALQHMPIRRHVVAAETLYGVRLIVGDLADDRDDFADLLAKFQ
ncbi:MAG: hypothetical protein E1N59_309 [Puniceicoccaceae bacterium 5H]|nr:MAG: hypothetical protein E1N59_309 [Puniceicoccaceae bacterium 5H]